MGYLTPRFVTLDGGEVCAVGRAVMLQTSGFNDRMVNRDDFMTDRIVEAW